MASNGEAFAPADVLGAVMTMRGGEQESKKKAHEYLERFQKSKGSWATVLGILQEQAEPEATLFAAITLRGKVRGLSEWRILLAWKNLTDASSTVDYLRSVHASPPRRARASPKPDPSPTPALRRRPQANPCPALRLPCHPGHPDEGLERRASVRRLVSQQQPREPRGYTRLPAGPARGGDRRSQNHPFCTSITRRSPAIWEDGLIFLLGRPYPPAGRPGCHQQEQGRVSNHEPSN